MYNIFSVINGKQYFTDDKIKSLWAAQCIGLKILAEINYHCPNSNAVIFVHDMETGEIIDCYEDREPERTIYAQ